MSTPSGPQRLMLSIPTKVIPFVGRYSSLSIHPTQDVALCVYDQDKQLYYSVGAVNKTNGEIAWGAPQSYDTGYYPSVDILCLEDSLYAVETHATGFPSSRCCCRVGKIDMTQKTIDWGNTKDCCSGQKPKICANDDGTVVVVYEGKHLLWGETLYHDIMKVNTEEKTLDVPTGRGCEKLDYEGVEPNITISEERVVLIYRSGVSELRSAIGELRRDQTRIEWNTTSGTVLPFVGKEPSIGLNTHGNLVEVHQTTLTPYRQLCYNYGHIADNAINWTLHDPHVVGEYPTIALADDGFTVEMHKTNFGSNLYQTHGHLVQ